jgi:phosphomevalonate kinase
MIALAPGKVILSGAYAVLYGAPAIVTAVDRYVSADASRTTDFVTPEVRAALGDAPAPYFDASALREANRKLGLGSSAAILVASLAARHPDWLATPETKTQLFQTALRAHRKAQGGGSGVDVLASVYGGTSITRRQDVADASTLEHRAITLPPSLFIQVWACPTSAETRTLIARVAALRSADPERHDTSIAALSHAAERAVLAVDRGDASGFVTALKGQAEGLLALGQAAGAPIVTPELGTIIERAAAPDLAILPAGAGGGDIALYVGLRPPSVEVVELAKALDHNPLSLRLDAKGAHVEGSA